MGTFVVGAILVIVVCLIVRSMIHDKKNGKSLQCGGDCKNCGGHCSYVEQDRRYLRTQMQKENIIQKLTERGCRITKQRLMLLDIILEEDCSCCKEIYYKASRLDDKIGTATVYRMVNTLEEIGAISRKNMYRITCDQDCEMENACTIEFDDNTIVELSSSKWNQIIQSGLLACGYLNGHHVRSIMAKSYE